MLVLPGVLDAPNVVTATAGDSQARATCVAPASNGGGAVNAYTVTAVANPAKTCTVNSGSPLPTTCTVMGLASGTAYIGGQWGRRQRGNGRQRPGHARRGRRTRRGERQQHHHHHRAHTAHRRMPRGGRHHAGHAADHGQRPAALGDGAARHPAAGGQGQRPECAAGAAGLGVHDLQRPGRPMALAGGG